MNSIQFLLICTTLSFFMVSNIIPSNPRTIPHTIIFKNESDVEQVIWINSEYILTHPETRIGSDTIRHPLAPNRTFVYGGNQYVFRYLEARLNPSSDVTSLTPLTGGVPIHGLAYSVSIVTIFDEGEYTVYNKQSFSYKMWKARLKLKAARKSVANQFSRAGAWVRDAWYSGKCKASQLAQDAKDKADAGAQRVSDTLDRISQRAGEAKEHTKEKLHDVKERTKEGVGAVSERLGELKEQAKEKVESLGEKAGEAKDYIKDRLHQGKEKVTDSAKKTSEELTDTKERMKEGFHQGEHNAAQAKQDEWAKHELERAAHRVGESKEQAKEKIGSLGEKAGEAKDYSKDRLHQGKEKVTDAAKKTSEELTDTKERMKEGFHQGERNAAQAKEEEWAKHELERVAQRLGESKEQAQQRMNDYKQRVPSPADEEATVTKNKIHIKGNLDKDERKLAQLINEVDHNKEH